MKNFIRLFFICTLSSSFLVHYSPLGPCPSHAMEVEEDKDKKIATFTTSQPQELAEEPKLTSTPQVRVNPIIMIFAVTYDYFFGPVFISPIKFCCNTLYAIVSWPFRQRVEDKPKESVLQNQTTPINTSNSSAATSMNANSVTPNVASQTGPEAEAERRELAKKAEEERLENERRQKEEVLRLAQLEEKAKEEARLQEEQGRIAELVKKELEKQREQRVIVTNENSHQVHAQESEIQQITHGNLILAIPQELGNSLVIRQGDKACTVIICKDILCLQLYQNNDEALKNNAFKQINKQGVIPTDAGSLTRKMTRFTDGLKEKVNSEEDKVITEQVLQMIQTQVVENTPFHQVKFGHDEEADKSAVIFQTAAGTIFLEEITRKEEPAKK